MIDVSEYMWKLEMVKLWIRAQIDSSTIFYETMRQFEETGHLITVRYDSTCSFEEFLFYASLQYK